jgi:hypothetical protein
MARTERRSSWWSRTQGSVALALAALSAPIAPLTAQLCQGTPNHGGVAYERGRLDFGTTNGLSGAVSAEHVALSGAYRSIDLGQSVTGNASEGRLAMVFGGSHIQVCPGFGLEYQTLAWQTGIPATLNTRQLLGRAGVGIGVEQPVYGGVSLIPFAVVQYAYRIVDYKLNNTTASVQETGDTASRGDAEYGLIAHYKFVYGGYTARHGLKNAPAYFARWVVGLAFSIGGGEGGSSPRDTGRAARVQPAANPKDTGTGFVDPHSP